MVQNRSILAKCLIDSSKTTQLSQILLFSSRIIMDYLFKLRSSPLQFGLVLHFHTYFVSELYTYHYSMSSLLSAIKHLERTFQATFIIDDSKNVSPQFSGHLFIFSIRTFSDRQSPINFR